MIFNPDLSKQVQEVIFSRKTKAKAPRCNIFVCMQCNLLRCMCLKKFPCSHLIRNSLQFFSFKIFTRRVSMSCTLKMLALLVLNEDENEMQTIKENGNSGFIHGLHKDQCMVHFIPYFKN